MKTWLARLALRYLRNEIAQLRLAEELAYQRFLYEATYIPLKETP